MILCSLVGTNPDKKGLETYFYVMRALLTASNGNCHILQTEMRDVLIRLHKKHAVFDSHISDKKTVFLVATDAADIFRIHIGILGIH